MASNSLNDTREVSCSLTALPSSRSASENWVETTLENLRNCLYGLRKALGDSEHRVIASDGVDIVLDQAAFEIDALVFRSLAASWDAGNLDRAVSLYPGVEAVPAERPRRRKKTLATDKFKR